MPARAIRARRERGGPAPRRSAGFFVARAEDRARLWRGGEIGLHEAVDVLQLAAVRSGLVKQIGQDAVQTIIIDAAFARKREQDELVEIRREASANAIWLSRNHGVPVLDRSGGRP